MARVPRSGGAAKPRKAAKPKAPKPAWRRTYDAQYAAYRKRVKKAGRRVVAMTTAERALGAEKLINVLVDRWLKAMENCVECVVMSALAEPLLLSTMDEGYQWGRRMLRAARWLDSRYNLGLVVNYRRPGVLPVLGTVGDVVHFLPGRETGSALPRSPKEARRGRPQA